MGYGVYIQPSVHQLVTEKKAVICAHCGGRGETKRLVAHIITEQNIAAMLTTNAAPAKGRDSTPFSILCSTLTLSLLTKRELFLANSQIKSNLCIVIP